MRKGEEFQLISDLTNISDKLTDWENQFLESISDQLDRFGRLSSKQLETLQNIYERRVLHY